MLTRRNFLQLTAASAAATLLRPALSWAQTSQPTKQPNVLFMIVDDLRPQMGCYGDKLAITPNIDKLAASGTRFDRAYVQQAVCSPSRTSLFTGCRPDTTKVYDLKTHFRDTIPNVQTVQQRFLQAGYHVQGLGKIYHNGYDDKASWSVPHWMPGRGQYALKENQDIVAARRAKVKEMGLTGDAARRGSLGPPFESADVLDNAFGDGVTAEQAIKVLGELKDKPFYLAVGFNRPHLPFVAPKKYWDLYDRKSIPLADNSSLPKDCPPIAITTFGELRVYHGMPETGPIDDETARTLIHGYYASMSYTDAQVGKVLDELDRLGLRENTIVVLVGDHGWKLGEHGLWTKHTNFELDTRAPMIVSAPGKSAGQSSRALVEFVDIYPTLCTLAGLQLPKHLEGTSFAALLQKPDLQWKAAAFSQYPRAKNMGYSMRTERYRFTRWQDPDGKVLATELYDHQADAKENVNIATEPANAELVEQLAGQLARGWKAAGPPASLN